ncbi:MAG: hypothetical protein RMY64_25595 [Nostoc sp. DedQUE08]|nr:hypothetical protein [Nostoc sp. DedQUE08]
MSNNPIVQGLQLFVTVQPKKGAIALAKQLRGEGLGYSKITDRLNELNLTTSKGG